MIFSAKRLNCQYGQKLLKFPRQKRVQVSTASALESCRFASIFAGQHLREGYGHRTVMDIQTAVQYLLSGSVQGLPLELTSKVTQLGDAFWGQGLTTNGSSLFLCGNPIREYNIESKEFSRLEGSNCQESIVADGSNLYYINFLDKTLYRRSLLTGEIEVTDFVSHYKNGLGLDGGDLFVFEVEETKVLDKTSFELKTVLPVGRKNQEFYL